SPAAATKRCRQDCLRGDRRKQRPHHIHRFPGRLGWFYGSARFDPDGYSPRRSGSVAGEGNGALLIGEGANRARICKITKIIVEDPAVERIGETLTMALLTVKIKFRQPLGLRELESVVRRIKPE